MARGAEKKSLFSTGGNLYLSVRCSFLTLIVVMIAVIIALFLLFMIIVFFAVLVGVQLAKKKTPWSAQLKMREGGPLPSP